MNVDSDFREDAEFDYIVVGSGAGGGPLASRLALAGYRVLVLEAGANEKKLAPQEVAREISEVPSFHGISTEHSDLSWQFYVKHYDKETWGPDEKGDPKPGQPDNDPERRGIFYPRAAALGGCTVHNAMITIAGPDSDWDDLADFLRDDTWRSEVMRPYFQKIECNQYLPFPGALPTNPVKKFWGYIRWLFGFSPDYTGGKHGFEGWLRTSMTDLSIGLKDWELIGMLYSAFKSAKHRGFVPLYTLIWRVLHGNAKQTVDPNHARTQAETPAGLALVPLAVCGEDGPVGADGTPSLSQRGHRSGPREFLLDTQAELERRRQQLTAGTYVGNEPIGELEIRTNCFVTGIIFDKELKRQDGVGENSRAIGVKYLEGEKLYHAHPVYDQNPPPISGAKSVHVSENGEVILAGGAFNTPQLLMLSGIGDREQLRKWKIPCRVHLPGVGLNLHDRYEVTLLSEMDKDFKLLEGAEFRLPSFPDDPDDPTRSDIALKEWRETGTGLYTSNGAVLAVLKRSRPDLSQPDLFIFGIPLPFEGYSLGYSDVHKNFPGKYRRLFTWAILKGHTRNHDGTVMLRSANPLETPVINFHSFHEISRPGKSDTDPDLLALVDGVRFVRDVAKRAGFVNSEFYPGCDKVPPENEQAIKDWIRRETWGHHACGTCRMGPPGDENAVLDSRFRVRDVMGLRVVDASIFPKIPGYFIVTNIYVASEKAADVIIGEAKAAAQQYGYPDSRTYPRELRNAEREAICERRSHVTAPEGEKNQVRPCPPASDGPQTQANDDKPEPLIQNDQWVDNVTGLGLSGGGVRSATLNLGILQALARGHWLRRIDFLSTASGGGYIGGFLGRFFDHLRHSPLSTESLRHSIHPGPARVEHELTDPDSPEIAWLRKNANYIAPAGAGDVRFDLAVLLRNLLSVHFVAGILVFALFGVANAIRYGLFDKSLAVISRLLPGKGDLPLGHLLEESLGAFYSPWFILFELILLFLVLPRMAGYWMASQDNHERYHWPGLAVIMILAAALLYVGMIGGWRWEPLFLGASLLSSFIFVELTWRRGRVREEAVGTGGLSTQRLRTRNYLTQDLGFALALAGVALGFALIDTLGHGIQQWVDGTSKTYAMAFARLGAALAALIPVARMAANFIAKKDEPTKPPSTLGRLFKKEIMAGLLALVVFTVPAVLYSFASHAAYHGGDTVWIGVDVTIFALFLAWILSRKSALPFVNRSSLCQTYASRLARAYLGASNPLRHHPNGANINEVMPGDDVASIRNYKPHESGGPLHLINVTINQTVDFTSQRGNRDRKGENLAVSSLGLGIGQRWHSFWEDETAVFADGPGVVARKTDTEIIITHDGNLPNPLVPPVHAPARGIYVYSMADYARSDVSESALPEPKVKEGQTVKWHDVLASYSSGASQRARAVPAGWPRGTDHPLLDVIGMPTEEAETLTLRQWIAISGAAVGPGQGMNTQLGIALLLGLANLRTGYWWDSGISLTGRDGFPHLTFLRRLLFLLPRFFITQALLLSECLARYPGPWARFWYLSDGGYFENLAAYELIRRRVPRIIIGDGGADPTYQFKDFANLIRKARIDFDAEIVPFDLTSQDYNIPAAVRQHLGTLEDLKPQAAQPKHAALFWVNYQTEPKRSSLLLYLKASLTGDETADVLNYHETHLEFPHESTGDQFFDEEQWESYRKLGEHIGSPLFTDRTDRNWFWNIELPRPVT